MGFPVVQKKWKIRQARKKRDGYGLKNLELANDFERALLIHYKAKNQQRFRARLGADHIDQMESHGLLINDSLRPGAYMRHYKIPDAIWHFLDAPPEGWDRGARLREINRE